MPKEEPLAQTNNFHHELFIILGVVQSLYGGSCSRLLSDGGRKEEERNLVPLQRLPVQNYSRNFLLT